MSGFTAAGPFVSEEITHFDRVKGRLAFLLIKKVHKLA